MNQEKLQTQRLRNEREKETELYNQFIKINEQINKHSHAETQSIQDQLKQIYDLQIENEQSINQIIKGDDTPGNIDIPKLLDDTEKFLIQVLSSPSRIEGFSNKQCSFKNVILVISILIIMFVIL